MQSVVFATTSRIVFRPILQVVYGKFIFKNGNSDQCQTVRPFISPPHLLLLPHSMTNNLVHPKSSSYPDAPSALRAGFAAISTTMR